LIRSPDEAGIWNNLGATLAALGRPGEALPAFRKATECEPPSTKAFLGIAFLQIHSGRLDEAVATLDRLDRVERSADAAALATRSVLARLRGDAIRADALEQQARRLDADATAWAIERAGNAGP
jgi:Flp pilus assembly protein TadD